MNKPKLTGFTLIELMITVAILAIIVSVAYPAYSGYTRTANRAEGKVALSQIAMAQERFFGKNNAYTTSINSLPGFSSSGSPFTSERGYYEVTVAAGATGGIATSFVLTATAKGVQASDTCTAMTLDSAGIKNGTPSKLICWP